MGRPARKAQAVERVREDILDAAAAVFAAKGYAGASVGAIAEEAGYTAPTLYVYFRGKRAIYDALRAVVQDELRVVLESPVPEGLTLEQRLEIPLHAQLAWAKRRRLAILALLNRAPPDAAESSEEDELIQLTIALYTAILEEHRDHPALARMEPDEAAYVLWGISYAYFTRWLNAQDETGDLAFFAPRVVRVFVGAGESLAAAQDVA